MTKNTIVPLETESTMYLFNPHHLPSQLCEKQITQMRCLELNYCGLNPWDSMSDEAYIQSKNQLSPRRSGHS